MNEIYWFWALVWFILIGLGYATDHIELKILGQLTGMLLGLSLFSESVLLSLALIFSNMALFLKTAGEAK